MRHATSFTVCFLFSHNSLYTFVTACKKNLIYWRDYISTVEIFSVSQSYIRFSFWWVLVRRIGICFILRKTRNTSFIYQQLLKDGWPQEWGFFMNFFFLLSAVQCLTCNKGYVLHSCLRRRCGSRDIMKDKR